MEELKCPQCQKQYSDNNPPRLLTMCGHTYCQHCLKSIIKRKDSKFQVRCPHDKMKMTLETASPLQLPRNMVLVQTMNKGKHKGDQVEQSNQFLPNNGQTVPDFCRSMSHTLKNSLTSTHGHYKVSKRSSSQEGLCLLHQKPLDIICLQEKISICAECALFGLHKGHSFTTIRDIQSKRSNWIGEISTIIQQISFVEKKVSQKQIKGHLSELIEKRKLSLAGQVHQFYTKVREALIQSEDKLIAQIEESLKNMETKVIEKALTDCQNRSQFKEWEDSILETIIQLQSSDVIKSLDVFADLLLNKEDHFINKGRKLLEELKNESKKIQLQIKQILESPKLQFEQDIHKTIESLVHFSTKAKEQSFIQNRQSIIEQLKPQKSFATQICFSQMENDQVSLLDLKDDFHNMSSSTINLSTTSKQNEPFQTQNSTILTLATNSQIQPLSFKKSKTKYLSINKSTVSINDNIRNTYMSPKFKRKTQFTSNNSINVSMVSNNNRLKKSMFKVKDPEKFNKLLKSLEANSAEVIDFTGLEMGNELAKDLFAKLKESSKVKNVRMMKNGLTDDVIPALTEALEDIEVLNLAQNNFSIKIVDQFLQVYRKKPPQKQKNIQLGQNTINNRRCKDKIEELRQLGIMISL